MKALLPFVVAMLCAWPAVSTGAEAEHVVGTTTLELENRSTSRRVTSELWFEADAEAKVGQFSARPIFRPVMIARGAAASPASGTRPLIVISHGNFGSRFSHGWLAVELVKAGSLLSKIACDGG